MQIAVVLQGTLSMLFTSALAHVEGSNISGQYGESP
jgi:hypothetical protein